MAQELQASTIPAHLGARTGRTYNVKFIAGGLLLLAFVAFLGVQIVQATRTNGAYYMTVNELKTQAATIQGERVRVNGNLVEGTEEWLPEVNPPTLKFSIKDEHGGILPVIFHGPRPDNFQRAASAIIEGELLPNGAFQAETLLLKCPSRYEEEPSEVFVKAQG
ncbi:MAG: cytochrome c maturation protein CcmE [Chloroflexi bacterium]|nr:cytochrome c maturation protein CcmE [Chloroflexota bacterium]